jgi:hypothetical protein
MSVDRHRRLVGQAAAVALVLWLLQPLPPLPARGPELMAANGAAPPRPNLG